MDGLNSCDISIRLAAGGALCRSKNMRPANIFKMLSNLRIFFSRNASTVNELQSCKLIFFFVPEISMWHKKQQNENVYWPHSEWNWGQLTLLRSMTSGIQATNAQKLNRPRLIWKYESGPDSSDTITSTTKQSSGVSRYRKMNLGMIDSKWLHHRLKLRANSRHWQGTVRGRKVLNTRKITAAQ